MRVYSVSELTREIKNLLETSFPPVWVEGEITDLRPARSQHIYFSLKDEHAILSCIIFKSDQDITSSLIKNGMMARVYGELNLYEKGGRYSLLVRRLIPFGRGDLHVRFEQLKKKLGEEGLFESSRKRPIPAFPERVGVITALHGAAIRDLVKVVRKRMKWVELVVRDTKVQGVGAKEDIARAIRDLNEWGSCDLIIVTRGGGSIEELWPFNEEIVARAIYESTIPVLSAVGHEIDYTVSDFVADARAATPSAAGESVVRDSREILSNINNMEKHIYNAVAGMIDNLKEKLLSLERSYGLSKPRSVIYERQQWADELGRRLNTVIQNLILNTNTLLLSLGSSIMRERSHLMERTDTRVNNLDELMRERFLHTLYKKRKLVELLQNRLSDLSPVSVLERGYSICFKLPEKRVISRSDLLSRDDRVMIKFSKGSADAKIEKVTTNSN